jgi:hypothetical protein
MRLLLCASLIITRLLRVCVDGGTWSSISSSDDDDCRYLTHDMIEP